MIYCFLGMSRITIFKTNTMKNAAEYVLDVLKHVDKTNLSVMRTVIVPDRASLEAERALLSAIGGSFNVQVRTFRRLANEILPKYDYLSKQSAIMALTGIVQDVKDRLTCYTKGVETAGFVADMYDVISMMKYCKISPEALARPDLPKGVAGKAHDVAVLYKAYLDFTADRFIDSADKLDLLCRQAAQSEAIKNSYFYLYDFDNFSAQELALVEQLATHSRGVTVACCASDKPQDKYLYLNDIYDGVLRLCKQNGWTPTVFCGENYQNAVAEQIGKHLYRYDETTAVECANKVEIYQGATRVQEVYALACRIQNYVRSGGRFRDIYVVTSDVDKYSNAVATVFDEFDVPYFCDKQFVLANHPFAQYVVDYFSVFRNNGKLGFVLPFVKNYLFCGNFDKSDVAKRDENVFHFENYCLKYNVSYDYNRFSLGRDEPYFAQADDFRKKFNALYAKVTIPQSATAREYVELARKLVAESQLNEKNACFAQQQQALGLVVESKVTVQAQQKFEEVLAQAEIVLGNRYMKLDDFLKLLTVALNSVKISVIPVSNDCVVFANMAKARKHDIKFLALLGANYGAMPIVKSDCKLLSDKNIQDLSSAGLNVEPQIFTENKRERFSLFQLLQEPSEKLYVSYAATDGKDALSPSQFVTEFYTLFCSNGKPLTETQEADENVYTEKQAVAKIILNTRKLQDNQMVKTPQFLLLQQKFGEEAQKYKFEKDGNVRVENGSQFYLKNSETSVSKLTDFYKCPYRYYFEYGLRVKPRSVAELKAADLGNILHAVLENYVREVDVNENDETTAENAERCFVDAIADDFYKGMRTDVNLVGILEQLKAESVRMCQVVKKQLKNSLFTNLATELSFGSNADLPPVEVDYGNGKFLLIGKIDRVDVHDGKFVVIDYKSGASAAHFSEKDVYVGHKLQLLVYVKAVQNVYGFVPAGFYYFNMHNNFTDVGQENVYVYSGRTLDDADVACALDCELKNGKSEKLGLRLNKDGTVSKRGNKLLTAQQFENQTEYSLEMIRRAGKLMQQGYASVSPYKGCCDYCDYKDVCDYNDVLVFAEREVAEKVTKETIDKTVEKCQNSQNLNKT